MEKDKVIPIQDMIYEIRGQKVMLDSDLATLYEVEVKALNRVVKRNIKRFPSDFMFQLTIEEWENLKRHFVASSLRYHFGTAKVIEKNDKRVNDIIIALNNLIEQPPESKTIGFRTG